MPLPPCIRLMAFTGLKNHYSRSGLEFVDKSGVSHPAVANWAFTAADGVEMPLEEGTSAFITMNPGYIGELDDMRALSMLGYGARLHLAVQVRCAGLG